MTPSVFRVANYARVSSEQQAEAHTIASQIAELQARIVADGCEVSCALACIDEGYSGAHVIRPALEHVRDLAADGAIDRLYVHNPDRFARQYAYQAILLEELTRAGVEVVFLNHAGGETPEDQLLVQVQGVIAEYERATFLARSRRGKRYAAQMGRVSVLAHAPYGYRYVSAQDGGTEARYEVVVEEARVVRQIFTGVGQERCTRDEVRRRLHGAGIRTRTGKDWWDHKTVWDLLKNPAYRGHAALGRTRSSPLQPRLRAPRGRPEQSRRGYAPQDVPADDGISIPVPALGDDDLFGAVAEQLQENQRRARIPTKGSRYLLQGLLVCAQCGYAYCGRTNDPRNAYYRCSGSDASRFAGTRLCWNKELRMDRLDAAVWQDVCQLLNEPQRLEDEYRRRLQPSQDPAAVHGLEAQRGKVRRGIARLIDGYAEGLIDKAAFEPRVTHLRERLHQLDQTIQQIEDEGKEEETVRLMIRRLEVFAGYVQQGLDQADGSTRREIIRTLVKRVEIDQDAVRVIFRVSPTLPAPPSEATGSRLHHCGERVLEADLQRLGRPR